MFKRRFRLPSPALVISMITLGLVLGGTAVAATTATHKDAKADTKLVKKLAPSLSVKHASTADSATNATNATNATHATSADSATHATSADSATNATHATNADQLGGVDASHYVRPGATLASGDTETGAYAAANATGEEAVTMISFSPKLAAAPTATEYVSGAPTSTCPGPGQAAAGRLCIYQGWNFNMTFACAGSPQLACGGTPTADGALVYFTPSNTQSNTAGVWAYRAP